MGSLHFEHWNEEIVNSVHMLPWQMVWRLLRCLYPVVDSLFL